MWMERRYPFLLYNTSPVFCCYNFIRGLDYWNADAFAFVVSATDTAGLSEARTELHKISKAREIGNSALVVLVNKSDLVDYHDYYGEGEKGEKGSSKQSKDGGKDVIKSVTTALDVGRVGFRVWTVKVMFTSNLSSCSPSLTLHLYGKTLLNFYALFYTGGFCSNRGGTG